MEKKEKKMMKNLLKRQLEYTKTLNLEMMKRILGVIMMIMVEKVDTEKKKNDTIK